MGREWRSVPDRVPARSSHWKMSVRARTIVYNADTVDPENLSGYAGLADEQWKDRLCLRTSQKVYNQSLVAMFIAQYGEERTEDIVRGWVDNLAAKPFSSDTEVLKAVAAGQCDVTIVNTYYLGRLLTEQPELPLKIFWPDQGEGEGGVHVNVSGAGVTRHAPNPELGQQLIEDGSRITIPDASAPATGKS